jgi:hypothetical protein
MCHVQPLYAGNTQQKCPAFFLTPGIPFLSTKPSSLDGYLYHLLAQLPQALLRGDIIRWGR